MAVDNCMTSLIVTGFDAVDNSPQADIGLSPQKMSIHQTAIVSPLAQLGLDVSVGPYAIIEDDTVLGDHCAVEAAAQIRKGTRLGTGCFVGSGAIIGADPQYRGFNKEIISGVIAGDSNVFREYVTVHRSIHDGTSTTLGCDNYLMAGTHIGHDSSVGNSNSMANNVLLGGHVTLGSNCFIGGGAAFHQFVRVGDYVMCQGGGSFSQDLPPFVIAAGLNMAVGIKSIGLQRAGFTQAERDEIKAAFRKIYRRTDTLQTVLDKLDTAGLSSHTLSFYQFFREKSKKGICSRSIGRKSKC